MRNLKKVLALVLAFSMMFSVVAFANYADVDADADYAGAVELLSALGILQGDDLGNFNPDNTITRAEYAAVVCRALGLENAANGAKGATQFTDVAADHWASGYINLATQNGIINGYGDGTFGPEDKVTYEQAVKMLVCALGFEPMAATKGGYPTGYLVIANQYKITAGVRATAEAPRSTVAQLVYNALSTPKMDQTSYGTDEKYEVLDGKNDRDYATLLTDMDIYIATGVVGDKNGDEIEITLTESSEDYEFGRGTDNVTVKDGFTKVYSTDKLDVKINDSNIEDYKHQNVDVYVEKISGKYYVLAVVASDIGETFEILSDDLKSVNSTATEIEYYDENKKTKTLKLASNATIAYNNKKAETFSSEYAAIIGSAGSFNDDIKLVFVENTGDTKYDTVVATQYYSDKIESVETSKDKIMLKNASTITFDFDDEDDTIIFEDINGNKISLEDFAEDDVVAIVSDAPKYDKPNKFADYIRVINLGDNSITGTVEATSTKNGDKTVTINGEVYVDGYPGGLNIDDEGTFWIGMTGKIIDFDGSAASKNYGFILEAAKSTNTFDDGWEVKLLTEDDGVVTYTFTTSADSTFSTYVSSIGIQDTNRSDKYNFNASTIEHSKTIAEKRLITFKTNAKGEIKSFAQAGSTLSAVSKQEYKDATQIIAKKTLEDDVVIFNLDKTDADDVYATDINYLVEDVEYTGYILKDVDDEYSVFIVTDGGTSFSDELGFAIVTDISSKKDADGQDITEVSYVQGEEEGVVTFDDDSEAYTGSIQVNSSKFGIGSIFAFNANTNGVVTDYVIVGNIHTNGVLSVDQSVFGAFSKDNEFVFGYISNTKRITTGKGETLDIVVDGQNDQTISVPNSSNRYTYYTAGKKEYIDIGDFMGGDDVSYLENEYDKTGNNVTNTWANYVFVRLVDGSVVDIYSFDTRIDVKNSALNGIYTDNDATTTSGTTSTTSSVVETPVEEVVEAPVEEVVIPDEIEANVIED